ncbi:MAG: tripartite tricarboxylate transporter substrate binding protein [Betaproteobacteria bacterium]|nr:tripartite tricarboxylate transporter substrate binding protein [Betaproteobacteria bacterium]
MNSIRRFSFVAAVALGLASTATHAQTYPGKPIRWIAPFPPGGGTDVISRTLAQKLTEAWGQQVIVENRPGSGGTIGLAAAVKSPADGYNIVLGQLANVAIAPGLYAKLPYDPVKDLTPVTLVLSAPLILVAHPSLPARNTKELLALARAKPDAITFGSPGNGTTGHLAAEMIKSATGVKMTHVPYKGASPAITGLLGGEIAIYVSSIPPALPMMKAGRLKALGVTSAKRTATLPDVPTISESGVPGYEVTNWYGVMLPAGVSKDLVSRLNTEIARILRLPEVRQRFQGEGGDVAPNTPEQFAAFIKSEIAKWDKAIKASGAKVD